MSATQNPVEACRLAINLARNLGYHVFPLGANKKPRRPERQGGQGWKDATADPNQIRWLWRHWPGPLIGVATGISGIDLLDIDIKHAAACAWWHTNLPRLPATRTYRSGGGGLHLHYKHTEGVRNSEGKLARGVDVRGTGGYLVHWYAAGCECLDHSVPAVWPDWLLAALLPKPTSPPLQSMRVVSPDRAIEGIVRRVAGTREGNRNSMLFWAAIRLVERGMRHDEIEALLSPVCTGIGLNNPREVRATIRSAIGRTG